MLQLDSMRTKIQELGGEDVDVGTKIDKAEVRGVQALLRGAAIVLSPERLLLSIASHASLSCLAEHHCVCGGAGQPCVLPSAIP